LNPSWNDFLAQRGARVESGVVAHFGDPAGELEAARSGSVLADLSHLGVLAFSGLDAETFLQAQLSCDVKAVPVGGASLGAYCTAKGRMLADFFLARAPDAFLMLLPRELVASVQKRLRMFVLRSKVEISDASDAWVLLGAAGTAAAAGVAALKLDAGLRFEIPRGRYLVALPPERAPRVWETLSATLRPAGSPAWEWLDIRNGVPFVGLATQDQLVPQMANLELIGGVSFKKGCYPGQEIVARAQYLGKVKRRMFLARLDGGDAPAPGDALYSDDLGDQASGMVVNARPAPQGGYDLLAVAQVSSRHGSTVRLKSPGGPALSFEPLPYDVE
jgi:folate-binding protein YgfZ